MSDTGGGDRPKTAAEIRAERIAASRAELARRHAEDPAAVERYHARQANLAAAARRERERFETRVLGQRPAPAPLPPKPKGMSRGEWKVEKQRLRAEAERNVSLAAKWSHKAGTPETLEQLENTHADSLVQLERNGTIDKEQSEWAAQIANVYRSIEADVGIKVASLEARVDQSRRPGGVGESIHRVRMHLAYGYWRQALPSPRQLVLDMIVGDAIGYSVAARRYRVHHRKAKRYLLDALNAWPDCVARAFRMWSDDDILRVQIDAQEMA